jgi:hypothetical protein
MTVSDVTGRDDWIVAKALCYAIVVIDSLPSRMQEASDCDDMKKLLASMMPEESHRERWLENARHHARMRPLASPGEGGAT